MFELLLIEDEIDAVRMVEKVLRPHGYNIHHAFTGLEGLDIARSRHLDIILVDMGLPDLDGKMICATLRGFLKRGTVPIIAFTAESGTRAKRLAMAVGCDLFISKPIDTRAFPGQLANILKSNAERINP